MRRALWFLLPLLLLGCCQTKYPDMVRDRFKQQLGTEGWQIVGWTECNPAQSSYSVTVSHKSPEHGTYRFRAWAHAGEPTVELLRPDHKTIWITVETWKRPFDLRPHTKMPPLPPEEEAHVRQLIEQVGEALKKAME
jgi:hypothetical protein